ncbi:hypothetical protein N9J52_01775 [Flavobacteriales bacterium]|nr:hypothetical protein [Flavobacteriales bacterium]
MMFRKLRHKRAVGKGTKFLNAQILSGKYGLACVGLSGEQKFSDQKGHLFCIYFMLNGLGSDVSELVRTIFITRILSEEHDGQWGYSPRSYYVEDAENPYFVDADDTAFALRSLRTMGIFNKTDAFDAYRVDTLLAQSSLPLFRTFISKTVYPKITASPSSNNNLMVHPEVNANLLQFFYGTDKEVLMNELFVTELQETNGLWPSYFYPIEFYSTYMFISLLTTYGVGMEANQKAIDEIIQTQKSDGSFGSSNDPLATAFALRSLQIAGYYGEPLHKGIRFLLKKQKLSGCWMSNSEIWKFHHDDEDVWTAFDTNHILTTSMCLSVLRESIA